MRNIKLTVEYDGTLFHGWQIQDKTKRTVQGEFEKAFKKIFKKERIRLIGSGRTDSGVHALGQAANFKTKSKLELTEIIRALNANLPEDIAVVEAKEMSENFHAQYSAKSKVYRYAILNRPVRSALSRNYFYFFPSPLNVNLMRQEAEGLMGKKDFRSFMASDPAIHDEKNKTTVRIMKNISIKRASDFIHIDIEANGFLYRMVRNIVGTLLDIGSGRLPRGGIKKILALKSRTAAGRTASAKGLCLMEVKY